MISINEFENLMNIYDRGDTSQLPPKTLEENFIDWESNAIGCGYGTGESRVIPVLRKFLMLSTRGNYENGYSYESIENEIDPSATWLLISILSRKNIIDYGTSPRFGWLTEQGISLRNFIKNYNDDYLIEILGSVPCSYYRCEPRECNCEPKRLAGRKYCENPFWEQ